jgi:hypothetical protein
MPPQSPSNFAIFVKVLPPLELTNTDPFAAWLVATEDATPDGVRFFRAMHRLQGYLVRNCTPLEPYSRTMSRDQRRPCGGGLFLMGEVPLYGLCNTTLDSLVSAHPKASNQFEGLMWCKVGHVPCGFSAQFICGPSPFQHTRKCLPSQHKACKSRLFFPNG